MTETQQHLGKLKQKEIEIITTICEKLNVNLDDFYSKRRIRHKNILPRFIASYLFKKLDYPLVEIGKIISIIPKDHTTIMHSIKTLNDLIDTDVKIKEIVYSLLYLVKTFHQPKVYFTSLKYKPCDQ